MDVFDAGSPYRLTGEEASRLDAIYNQLYIYDALPVTSGAGDSNALFNRKQGSLGVLQVPDSLENPLLSPCRPGARNDNNYKCTNPLV